MLMSRRRRAPLAAAGLALALAHACGGNPGGPSPTPSASPTPVARVAGGDLAGSYTFEITPSAGCGLTTRPTFLLTLTPAGATPYPGVQGTHVVDTQRDAFALELETIHASNAIRGSFATRHDGVLAQENVQVWIHSAARGDVTRLPPATRGEILDGVLAGYVAFGGPGSPEGSLGSCTAADHRFRLVAR
jgi:hypothetical protein